MDLKQLFGKKTGATVENVMSSVSNINPLENMSDENRREVEGTLDKVLYYITGALIFLAPLFVLPIVSDWFDFPRVALATIFGLIAALLWSFRATLARRLTLTTTVFDLAVFLIAVSSIVSAVLSRNRFFSLSADPVVYLSCALIFFLIVQNIKKTAHFETFVKLPLIAGVIVSVWTVIQVIYMTISPSLNLSLPFPFLSPNFSLTGSPLSQLVFLVALLPLAFGFRSQAGPKKTNSVSLFLVIITIGVAASAYTLFQNQPILLPPNAGWRIATATLGESVGTAFFGAGPGNFVDAFTQYKPIDLNNSRFWNLRFSASSNHYFYLLTTLGIAGLASFLLLILRFIQIGRSALTNSATTPLEKGLVVGIALILVGILVIPASTTTMILLFILLGLLAGYLKVNNSPYVKPMEYSFLQDGIFRTVLTLSLLVATLGITFYLGRLLLADYFFASSLSATRSNRGNDTYNNQIQAIRLNPWNSSYRVAYSNTNLALANSLAGQPNLTTQQRQAIVQLVQQSIREGRVAAGLDNRRASNWENLSLIYRNLINFAQGADQWALATQNQAVNFDPINPRLRLDLGGIYYALQNYQLAGQIFVQAVNLKPDYANAHYNLAQALKQLNQREQALVQLQLAASIVCSAQGQAATDCQRVNAEITSLGSTPASPAAGLVSPGTETEIRPASPAAQNIDNARTQPPSIIGSPSGELEQAQPSPTPAPNQ